MPDYNGYITLPKIAFNRARMLIIKENRKILFKCTDRIELRSPSSAFPTVQSPARQPGSWTSWVAPTCPLHPFNSCHDPHRPGPGPKPGNQACTQHTGSVVLQLKIEQGSRHVQWGQDRGTGSGHLHRGDVVTGAEGAAGCGQVTHGALGQRDGQTRAVAGDPSP